MAGDPGVPDSWTCIEGIDTSIPPGLFPHLRSRCIGVHRILDRFDQRVRLWRPGPNYHRRGEHPRDLRIRPECHYGLAGRGVDGEKLGRARTINGVLAEQSDVDDDDVRRLDERAPSGAAPNANVTGRLRTRARQDLEPCALKPRPETL